MKENFHFECQCGRKIRVELYEAGTTKQCPACNVETTVPNTIKLKELSGDKYPHLSPFDKIQKTLEEGESPFDGVCHYCYESEASYQVPITFRAMKERAVMSHGGIRSAFNNQKLIAEPCEEKWASLIFPLFLCEECHSQFVKTQSWSSIGRIGKIAAFLIFVPASIYLAFYIAVAMATFTGFIILVFIIAWAMRLRGTKEVDHPFIFHWLKNIRWVPEMINSEDEYKLSIGKSLPYHREC